MTILALQMGPPLEWIIGFFLIMTFIVVFIILALLHRSYNKITWSYIWQISFAVPVLLLLLFVVVDRVGTFIQSPMTVWSFYLNGDYVIDRDMFSGKNTEWEYDHYWLNIADDTLRLNVMHKGILIGTYKRHFYIVEKGKHQFLEFYDIEGLKYDREPNIRHYAVTKGFFERKCQITDTVYSRIPVSLPSYLARIDSVKRIGNHHMLELNPLLHADKFSFELILKSKKYQNMFFKKGHWAYNNK